MEDFNWLHFIVIFVGSIVGVVGIMPYAFELNKDKLAEAPLPLPKLMLLSFIQGAILFAIVTFLGLNAATSIGLEIISPISSIPLAMIAGILGATLLVVVEVIVFQPHIPAALKDTQHTLPVWKRFFASFYGGISEEILTRLFLVSAIAWVLGQVIQLDITIAIPIAIFISAILFGIGHLPATAAMTPLTPIIIVRAIVLNSIIGVVCGWLFWQYGLVAAMIAHFCADIILHVIAPPLLSKYNNYQEMTSIQPV